MTSFFNIFNFCKDAEQQHQTDIVLNEVQVAAYFQNYLYDDMMRPDVNVNGFRCFDVNKKPINGETVNVEYIRLNRISNPEPIFAKYNDFIKVLKEMLNRPFIYKFSLLCSYVEIWYVFGMNNQKIMN